MVEIAPSSTSASWSSRFLLRTTSMKFVNPGYTGSASDFGPGACSGPMNVCHPSRVVARYPFDPYQMLPTVCRGSPVPPPVGAERSPMPASLFEIQWRTSKASSFFFPPSSNSNVTSCVFGVS